MTAPETVDLGEPGDDPQAAAVADARGQANVLHRAAGGSSVRQLRYELRRRAREWERAASDLAESDGEGAIELVGSVTAGMAVFDPTSAGNWQPVVRQLTRDGQFTLHYEVDGRPLYRNFWSASSPTVVQR